VDGDEDGYGSRIGYIAFSLSLGHVFCRRSRLEKKHVQKSINVRNKVLPRRTGVIHIIARNKCEVPAISGTLTPRQQNRKEKKLLSVLQRQSFAQVCCVMTLDITLLPVRPVCAVYLELRLERREI
jgi:hypothetical protein